VGTFAYAAAVAAENTSAAAVGGAEAAFVLRPLSGCYFAAAGVAALCWWDL